MRGRSVEVVCTDLKRVNVCQDVPSREGEGEGGASACGFQGLWRFTGGSAGVERASAAYISCHWPLWMVFW